MITAIYSLGQVRGAELWLLFWLLCGAAYWGLCLAIRSNRSRRGVRTVLMGFLVAEVTADLLWALIYYDNGVYLNYGIGAVYGLLSWIPALLMAAGIVSAINRRGKKRGAD